MDALPKSIYPLIVFVAIALLLVALAGIKKSSFLFCRSKGNKLYEHGDYESAVLWLARAENYWGLNLTWQTPKSFTQDLEVLKRLLSQIQDAAKKCGANLDMEDYQRAAETLRQSFNGSGKSSAKIKGEHGNNYALAYAKFKVARREFRGRLKS